MSFTERQAIEKSVKMWQWLHDHPTKGKNEYLKITKGKFRCHCCVYYVDCGTYNKPCPLSGNYICDYEDDPEQCGAFYKWDAAVTKGNSKTSKKYSGIILSLLKAKERQLNGKKKC
jgi:hypothetical protein